MYKYNTANWPQYYNMVMALALFPIKSTLQECITIKLTRFI